MEELSFEERLKMLNQKIQIESSLSAPMIIAREMTQNIKSLFEYHKIPEKKEKKSL